jgi:hypothetical protein
MNRNISLLKILLAFLIAGFLSLSGFLIGYSFSYLKYQEISLNQESIKYDLLKIELESNFLEFCDKNILSRISEDLNEMGSIMAILEERWGKSDERILEQKKRYSLLEVQHFLNIKKFQKSCNESLNVIFLFYSNSGLYIDSGERIGSMLTFIKEQKDEEVMIYSFDYDLDLSTIRVLKEVYNVTSPNTLVINEKVKLIDPQNIDDIKKHLI